MGRAPCCSGEHAGLKRGPWTAEEDRKLQSFLLNNPTTCWRQVPTSSGLLRCGKSCRLRWVNYLRPDIRRGNFTAEEESMIIRLHAAVGNKWAVIASQLPGRTDNEIKNLWNTKLKKRLVCKGINPITHQPFCSTTLYGYIEKWIKSIEDVIITGILTKEPESSGPQLLPTAAAAAAAAITDINQSNISSQSLGALLQSFMSHQSNSSSQIMNYCGNEDFSIDRLVMNRTDSNINPNYELSRYEFGDDRSRNIPFVAGDMDAVASNGPVTLEEGVDYWN
ncbi:hypothetical protein ACLOJK_012013 [Asimina triloba]